MPAESLSPSPRKLSFPTSCQCCHSRPNLSCAFPCKIPLGSCQAIVGKLSGGSGWLKLSPCEVGRNPCSTEVVREQLAGGIRIHITGMYFSQMKNNVFQKLFTHKDPPIRLLNSFSRFYLHFICRFVLMNDNFFVSLPHFDCDPMILFLSTSKRLGSLFPQITILFLDIVNFTSAMEFRPFKEQPRAAQKQTGFGSDQSAKLSSVFFVYIALRSFAQIGGAMKSVKKSKVYLFASNDLMFTRCRWVISRF